MACPVIIRRHDGFQSYLVLDDNPGVAAPSGLPGGILRAPLAGLPGPPDAREEWAEMLGEDPDNYIVTDSDHREYCTERTCWDDIRMWPESKP